MPRAEVAYVGELPVTVSAVAPAGSVVPAGSPAIELASGPLVVRAEVQQNLATALRPGMRGEITVGAEPPIAVTVATVRSTTDAGDSGTPTSDVVLIPDEPLSQPVDAPVHAIVTLAATDGETLAVPVAAVTQTPDGRTFVSVLRHGTSNRVEVRVGPSGDGWVSITPLGGGLSARTRVVLGRRSA